MGKNVRFSDLVKASGRPQIVTLWTVPGDNPEIKKAIRENRILSVKQDPRSNKKEFGKIGFREEKNFSYFIFPKSLQLTKEAHVVGIKYDLVDQPKVTDVVTKKDWRKPKAKKGQRPVSDSVMKKFSVVVKKTAVWETTLAVEALTKTEAERDAKNVAAARSLPLSEAIVETAIREVHEEK
jgi:hypothetical protein